MTEQLFTIQDRQIFDYQDGETRDTEGNVVTVYADPLEIDRAMSAALGGEVDKTIDLCREYEADDAGAPILDDKGGLIRVNAPDVVAENYRKLCAAVCAAFKLQPFTRLTGKGATVAMCIRLWNHYRAWVKKNTPPDGSSPTS